MKYGNGDINTPESAIGIGCPIGDVTLEDGQTVDGGRLLMRDSWNADLCPPLKEALKEEQMSNRPDVRFYKSSLSGLRDFQTPLTEYSD